MKNIYKCGDSRITVLENGIIEKAENMHGMNGIMWGTENLENELVGMHIIDFAELLKKYAISENIYYGFIKDVILPDYQKYIDNEKDLKNKIKKINNTL